MLDQAKSRKSQRTASRSRLGSSAWIWVVIGAIIILGSGAVIWWARNPQPFSLVEGNQQLVVLIRSDKESEYRIRYDGNQPINLQSVKVMLAGQVLHVDVREVAIIQGDRVITLAGDGNLLEGTELVLQPGDEFDVRVTFRGQTLGGNYLYGFEIGFLAGERERTDRLVLDYEYAIIVE